MPVFVADAVTEIEGVCPIFLPNHRWTLCRIEDHVVGWLTVVEIVTVKVRLAKVILQGNFTVGVLRILPQVHKLNRFLVRKRPLWSYHEVDGLIWPNKDVMVVRTKEYSSTIQRVPVTDQGQENRMVPCWSITQ